MACQTPFRVMVALAATVVVFIMSSAPAGSQSSCPNGVYTLNGDLKVTGKVEAANIVATNIGAAQGGGVSSCVAMRRKISLSEYQISLSTSVYPYRPVMLTCPAGKVVTGGFCRTSGAYGQISFCQLVVGKDGIPLPDFNSGTTEEITGVNSAGCNCGAYGGYGQTITMFCCG